MEIVKETIAIGIIITILILVGPMNVYAKPLQSENRANSTSAIADFSTKIPTEYATKPGAFLSKCHYSSSAVSDIKNATSIAFNQHELGLNHWILKPSNGPTSGAYICLLEIVPNIP